MSTSTERMRRLRARRAALLKAPAGPPLCDPDELLGPAVEDTLEALGLGERDAAAAQLARRYAAAIDAAGNPASAMRWLATAAGRAPGDPGGLRPAIWPAGEAWIASPGAAAAERERQLARLDVEA